MTQEQKHVHIIGIAGAAMSGMAVMLKHNGYSVSGSDAGAYGPTVEYLQSYDIDFSDTYRAENIPEYTDMVIIGNHAKLDKENCPEVAAVFDRNLEYRSFPQVLRELAEDNNRIVIAGSYGKSTCTALATHILKSAGKDPSYMVGARALDLETTCALGSGKDFVMEGDEYRTLNWDMNSKFMYLEPHSVLLTSGEYDHTNFFKTEDDYVDAFRRLLQNMSDSNLVVGCIDNPHVSELLVSTQAKTVSYSLENTSADWYGQNISYGDTTTCTLYHGEHLVGTFETSLLGAHNIQNCIGVAALLLEQKIVTFEELAAGIRTFRGVTRRLVRLDQGVVPTYEGFGTSAAKARAAISAVKLHYPNKNIIVVFEPHAFSWRDRKNRDWYKNTFDDVAHLILFTPPKKDGKDMPGQLSIEDIRQLIEEAAISVVLLADAQSVVKHLEAIDLSTSVILMLSSGGLDNLPSILQNKYTKK